MHDMAIYSLNHRAIGRSTQKQPGTAAAHVRYITRTTAASTVMAERMPANRNEAQAWLLEQESTSRKNGRVVDKVMVALPLELDPAQRAALVRDFAQRATLERAPWLAAIHDQGKDAANPHAHIVIRDRDPDTGKRVAGLSDMGRRQRDGSVSQSGTERLRELWEQVANEHLARADQVVRIDRRSLDDQRVEAVAVGNLALAADLDRAPQVHVGPKAMAMATKGLEIRSEIWTDGDRIINYPAIDQGQSRAAHNAGIRARNGQAMAERAQEAAALAAKMPQDAQPSSSGEMEGGGCSPPSTGQKTATEAPSSPSPPPEDEDPGDRWMRLAVEVERAKTAVKDAQKATETARKVEARAERQVPPAPTVAAAKDRLMKPYAKTLADADKRLAIAQERAAANPEPTVGQWLRQPVRAWKDAGAAHHARLELTRAQEGQGAAKGEVQRRQGLLDQGEPKVVHALKAEIREMGRAHEKGRETADQAKKDREEAERKEADARKRKEEAERRLEEQRQEWQRQQEEQLEKLRQQAGEMGLDPMDLQDWGPDDDRPEPEPD